MKKFWSILFVCCAALVAFYFLDIKTGSQTSSLFEYVEDKATAPILNPTLANRKVAKIRLNNGLEAYIISDPETDQSGASLAVEAGSWADPKEYPGMAHFCEHMLFMGTKAYPDESEYMQFIGDHGGHNNAFTASDRTVYMFCINNDAFTEGLNRFAHFFIDPLFNSSSVNRELLAVDQEHAKNIENDGWREYMILKETGNPVHPNAGFSTGNAQTLGGIPREALVQWYEKNYSANRMHLVVISSLPLDELVSTVARDFSLVPNYKLPAPTYPFDLFTSQQEGHFIYIKPIKDIKNLSLVWQAPKDIAEDRDHAVFDMVAYALNSADTDSLSQELKKEQLAESLSCSSQFLSQNESIFEINVSLTEKGIKNLNTVVTRCFQAINRLKEAGIPSYIFEEAKQMALINYEYQTRQECFSFVEDLGSDIIYEPLETFPQKLSIPTSYDPSLLKAFITSLTPETCVFFVQADPKLTGVQMTSKEKWMGAEYTIQPISPEVLTTWKNAPLHPHIQLPEVNPFIPQNLSLLPPSSDQTSAPDILSQTENAKIYFKQDSQYQVPTAVSIFSLKSPLLNGSAKSTVLFDLYLYSLQEKLYSPLVKASAAGLHFESSQQDLKVVFSTSGYNDKQPDLLKTIFKSLSSIHPSSEEFFLYKERLLRQYQNMSKELPVRQGIEILQNVISTVSPTHQEKYTALKQISYDNFTHFCQKAFTKAYIEGLIYGNFSAESAKSLWKDLNESLNAIAYPLSEQIKKKVLILPESGGPFQITTQTDMQGNGMILTLEEGPLTLEARGAQQVLSTFLSRDFFDTLRTKQQTGYIVQTRDIEIEKELFQNFFIQSSSYEPQELLSRTEQFLNHFDSHFSETLPSQSFETIRNNLITLLQMPPENQEAMAALLNQLAFKYDGDFKWIEKRITSLKALSYDSLTNYAHSCFSKNNLRRLAILVKGKSSSSASSNKESETSNPLQFHTVSPQELRSLSTYSSQ